MAYERILLEKANGVCTLTINRPESNNALDPAFFREFGQCMSELNVDDSVRVIIITGKGRFFSPGADVTAFADAADDPAASGWGSVTYNQPFGLAQVLSSSLRECLKPTIAAINGPVAGVGLSLVCLCDYRIASDTATFTAGFIKLGLASEMGLTYLLPRITNLSVALEFLSTGTTRDATWAEKIGLVREVVPAEDLMDAAHRFADTLAKMSPLALQTLKQLVYDGLNVNFDAQQRSEGHAASILIRSEDHRKSVRAFIEEKASKSWDK